MKMAAISILKSEKSDQIFIKFDYGLILSLLCKIKQSPYVKGGTHPLKYITGNLHFALQFITI